jgi:peptidylprolyl isomerase
MSNPRVFFDVTIGGSPAGRIVMELFADQVPKVSTAYPAIRIFIMLIISE